MVHHDKVVLAPSMDQVKSHRLHGPGSRSRGQDYRQRLAGQSGRTQLTLFHRVRDGSSHAWKVVELVCRLPCHDHPGVRQVENNSVFEDFDKNIPQSLPGLTQRRHNKTQVKGRCSIHGHGGAVKYLLPLRCPFKKQFAIMTGHGFFRHCVVLPL